MVRNLGILFLLILFGNFVFSQEETETQTEKTKDSLTTALKKEGVSVEVATFERKAINPLAPSKAAFYSAILPGLGQIYNKRYWKAPIVWGALGTGIYVYSINNTEYNRYRTAFKQRRAGLIDEFFDLGEPDPGKTTPDVTDEALENAQERFQRDRDLALLITIALYALNIIDANVDAHLKQYNVDENLGFDIKPYLNMNPVTSSPNYGLAMTIKF
ncbi:DUF5683 domain-containing protein [Allomuricauda sp. SCSIO 65647]|uniref:DUF5683 domain-containing protein n=1 Tax=Allomuricauda sp. SCSIO 65647 TaxID=2908843 RepID=UPI001F2481E7|nr:DUF5683 domain-containing protein [Muricauda sp. SCSIO 65647]UJH67886.1 DUF5683 domain-containing protein [Muricauda sp. SCSIO 65647]